MNAEHGEIILVSGKGHEKEQIYKNKIISISDSQIIKKLERQFSQPLNNENNVKNCNVSAFFRNFNFHTTFEISILKQIQ